MDRDRYTERRTLKPDPSPHSALAFWGRTALLAPWLVMQARATRRRTPRLVEAPGARNGRIGESADRPLQLLCVGESPAAGVGIHAFDDTITPHAARALHNRLGCPVEWRVHAENGANAQRIGELFDANDAMPNPDVVLVVCGVNDVTRLTSIARWRRALHALCKRIVDTGAVGVFTGVPPMEGFTTLRDPLRTSLSQRARLLDAQMEAVVATYAPITRVLTPPIRDAADLADDGYHPSGSGSQGWAEHTIDALVGRKIENCVAARRLDPQHSRQVNPPPVSR